MEYSEYTTKGWRVFSVESGTSYPMTDYHKTESEAWEAYRERKLYDNQVRH